MKKLRQDASKILIAIALLLTALTVFAPAAYASTRLADANVTVLTFTRATSTLQPPSASGTATVNTQTGTVDVALQGFTPGAQLQLLFAGVSSIVLGPVAIDLSGSGGAAFILLPAQYSGSFELVSLGAIQMVTRPATFTIVAGTSSTTTTASSSTQHEPPGLTSGWATSTVTVMSTTFSQTLTLNGATSVTLSSISLTSSTNGQIMENIASNDHIVQVEFDHDGGSEVVIQSSAKPAAVYADDRLLAEASSTNGLTFNSNAWVYDQNSATLTVFADPSTVTVFYGSTPVPEFPTSLLALTLPLFAFAATFLLAGSRKRRRLLR